MDWLSRRQDLARSGTEGLFAELRDAVAGDVDKANCLARTFEQEAGFRDVPMNRFRISEIDNGFRVEGHPLDYRPDIEAVVDGPPVQVDFTIWGKEHRWPIDIRCRLPETHPMRGQNGGEYSYGLAQHWSGMTASRHLQLIRWGKRPARGGMPEVPEPFQLETMAAICPVVLEPLFFIDRS